MYKGEVIGLGDMVYNMNLFHWIDEMPSDDDLLLIDIAIESGYQTSATTLLSKLQSNTKPAKTNLSNSKLTTNPSVVLGKFRLMTCTFKNKTDLHNAALKLKAKEKIAVYEVDKSGLRLMTGTYVGKEDADQTAAKIKKEFGWVVYVKEA
ncbi:MAG: hypothetical protein QJR05_07955 [Thermoanaerobacterium sp.]|nr:hypothetical protein [Thermoanaerobacterium sp.]